MAIFWDNENSIQSLVKIVGEMSLEISENLEHKESNICQKYDFSINAFYKINYWPILKD